MFSVTTVIGEEKDVSDIEMIINSGVDVNVVDKKHERTPLHYASANGKKNISAFGK